MNSLAHHFAFAIKKDFLVKSLYIRLYIPRQDAGSAGIGSAFVPLRTRRFKDLQLEICKGATFYPAFLFDGLHGHLIVSSTYVHMYSPGCCFGRFQAGFTGFFGPANQGKPRRAHPGVC